MALFSLFKKGIRVYFDGVEKSMHKYDIEKIDKLNICINETITVTENIGVRYSLSLPFKNVTAGLTITIVLMNPSTANLIHSDGTVNKLINFFYNYKN